MHLIFYLDKVYNFTMGYLSVTGNIMTIILVLLELPFWVTYCFKCAEILNLHAFRGSRSSHIFLGYSTLSRRPDKLSLSEFIKQVCET